MKIARTLLSLGLTVAPLFADVDLSKLPPVSEKKGLTYEKDIRPILEASCFRCHGEERHRGELRLDSLAAALKGGEDGKVILPGKSKESPLVIAVAQLDEEKAMPPKRGPGGPGGAGGPGGRGGFGPGNMIASQLMAQGDKDQDQKLTKVELTTVVESWFGKMDAEKAGKLSQQQFVEKLGDILPPPQGGGRNAGPGAPPPGGGPGGNGGGGRGFNPGQFIGPGFFGAVDTDKDGTLTLPEFKGAFEKWFGEWDTDKSGSLDETKIRTGLNAALPRPNFAGGQRNGPGGNGPANGPGQRQGGGPGPGGPGGAGGGPPPKPLTPEQVGLVRAWIDQGAR